MKDCLKIIDQTLACEPDQAFARRARIIFENLNLEGNEKVLEVGCGRGFYLRVLQSVWPGLKIVGVDVNQRYLKKAKDFIGDLEEKLKDNLKENLKVELKVADATDLPFKDNFFDRVIATEILEHIPDDKKAIAEIYRVLKPGGIAMITVPNKDYPFLWDPLNWILERGFHWHIPQNIWWLAGIWADHVRLYNEREIREKMGKPAFSASRRIRRGKKKTGFKVEKVWHATHYCFPFSHFLFYGIGKNLVEKGLFSGLNRFSCSSSSFFSKILLTPIKIIDRLNNSVFTKSSSVNIIVKANKRK